MSEHDSDSVRDCGRKALAHACADAGTVLAASKCIKGVRMERSMAAVSAWPHWALLQEKVPRS